MKLTTGAGDLAAMWPRHEDLKVLRSVVVFHCVPMVNLLPRSKVALQDLFHHKPMLGDVASLVSAGMIGGFDVHIPTTCIPATLPVLAAVHSPRQAHTPFGAKRSAFVTLAFTAGPCDVELDSTGFADARDAIAPLKDVVALSRAELVDLEATRLGAHVTHDSVYHGVQAISTEARNFVLHVSSLSHRVCYA